MSKFCTKANRMTFDDFVLSFLGLPKDFFTMDLMKSDEAIDSGSGTAAVKSLRPVLPASTTIQHVQQLFRTRLRKRLFNVDGAIICALNRQSVNDKEMTEAQLFNAL